MVYILHLQYTQTMGIVSISWLYNHGVFYRLINLQGYANRNIIIKKKGEAVLLMTARMRQGAMEKAHHNEIDLKETTGRHIEKLMRRKGLTVEETADFLYVSVQAVYKWRRGESLPEWTTAVRLCELLGTTLDELILPNNTRKE